MGLLDWHWPSQEHCTSFVNKWDLCRISLYIKLIVHLLKLSIVPFPCFNAITGLLTVNSFKNVFIRNSKYPNHTVYSVKWSNVAMYPTCYWEEVTLKNYTKYIYPHKVYCYVVQCNPIIHKCHLHYLICLKVGTFEGWLWENKMESYVQQFPERFYHHIQKRETQCSRLYYISIFNH